MKNISIIVNSSREAAPMLHAMLSSKLKPKEFPSPLKLYSPRNEFTKMKEPRAVFLMNNGARESVVVKVYCIQDFMYPRAAIESFKLASSNSQEKYRVLPHLIKSDPDLVITAGTAAGPDAISLNGSIIIGGNFFIHDGQAGNSQGHLTHPDFGQLLACNVNAGVFNLVDKDFKSKVAPKFLQAPLNAAKPAICKASCLYSAISTVNVTDDAEDAWIASDPLAHFKQIESTLPANSVETTHGLIKLCTDKPILFVSAITNRLGCFKEEVTPAQNYVASFNAGIFMSQFIVSLNEYFLKGGVLDL
ncbi:carbohydrate-binding domain-containing protein [Niabella hibiscisoli]|uniref:carbohydrate-binding domain-containing protein n=1 Tax=Niabella hibiscisoli TaxID=1825928 RepID=UPI001F10320B|nr:carbohydrate-binding domain-containing protein [Niabella hibiscisoli]MCH5719570.1 carbohydrate-binding domain-containing protein [Niabella hibiscisoli]